MSIEQWAEAYAYQHRKYHDLVSTDNRFCGNVIFTVGPGYSWYSFDILPYWQRFVSLFNDQTPPDPPPGGGDEMTDEIFVNDVRQAGDSSLGPVPRITTYTQLQQVFGLTVDRSKGWDACPAGKQCWKLVGFEVRPGAAEFIAQVKGLDGNLSNVSILTNFNWPNAPHEYDPAPVYFTNCVGGWTNGGRVGFPYGAEGMVQPGGGPYSIWPNNAPPNLEPQYSDCAKRLGWLGGTDHLTPNPIWQLTIKPGGDGDDDGDDGEPPVPPTATDWARIAAALRAFADKLEEGV